MKIKKKSYKLDERVENYKYKYRKNKTKKSSVKTTKFNGKSYKQTSKYDKKGQKTSIVDNETNETTTKYSWSKGYPSKISYSSGVVLKRTGINKRSNGLLKQLKTKEMTYGSEQTFTFNKRGFVTRNVDCYDNGGNVKGETTLKHKYTYTYNKNGTVKSITTYVGNSKDRKYEFKYNKKKTSKKRYAGVINYFALEYVALGYEQWLLPLK